MKIVISPSKTQNPNKSSYLNNKEVIYIKEHKRILSLLNKLSKEDLKKVMKIKNSLLDITYDNINNYSKLGTFQAFESFNGLVYKGLEKQLYKSEEYNYIESHIIILDALYGILEAGTLIKPYRLDMKMKIGVNLYKHWNIDSYFKDELVINLASNEFSKMLTLKNLVNIKFLQYKNNSYINQATYSKQARGLFLNYLILNQMTNINNMLQFSEQGYSYNTELSDEFNIIFSRTI